MDSFIQLLNKKEIKETNRIPDPSNQYYKNFMLEVGKVDSATNVNMPYELQELAIDIAQNEMNSQGLIIDFVPNFSEPIVGLLNIAKNIAKSISKGNKAIYTLPSISRSGDDETEMRCINSVLDRGLAVFNEQTQQVAITNAGASILLKLLTECNKDIDRETNFSLRTFGSTDANAFRTCGRSDIG
jgi:hypothetical protein